MAVGTPHLEQAIRKAAARAARLEAKSGVDLGELSESSRERTPEQLNTPAEKEQRRQFLESLYDTGREAEQAYERIIAGNELQGVNFLPRGAFVARPVVRITVRTGARIVGYGTGFFVGDGILITNNHVLQDKDVARDSLAEAFYEFGPQGEEAPLKRFALDPDRLFFTTKDLDFTIVAVARQAIQDAMPVSQMGWLPLIGTVGKVVEGEWLTIIQHPEGERKQVCVRENQLVKRDDDVLWYSTDTLAGSSGSPVFNNDWLLVALHHSGVPETVNGKWQTIHGGDYDPARDDESQIKWKANEGIRISRIVETLRTDNAIAKHPLVVSMLDVGVDDVRGRLPIMFPTGTPVPKAITDLAAVPAAAATTARYPTTNRPSTETTMATHLINITLAVDDTGTVSVQDQSASESFVLEAGGTAAPKKKKPVIEAPVVPKTDWVKGFDPDYLGTGDMRVNLPEVLDAGTIAPLKAQNPYTKKNYTPAEQATGVLDYNGYSVVMNKERRFAFFSAANVDGGMRPRVSGRVDDWLFDDRISRDHQVDNSYYRKDLFDRGHLTRREDMEWGTDPVDAVRRANGTCTWTNCTPQHGIFNKGQEPNVLLWQQLEDYILEQTAEEHNFKVQVITGPIFGIADPVFRQIPYPLDFWKVVVAVATRNGKDQLFATGYILSQKETIAKHGLEEALEAPFGAFGTYQRSIGVLENATGLNFTYGSGANRKPLSQVDPLTTQGWRPKRRRRGAGPQEAFGLPEDDALQSLDDIILR